MALMTVPMLPSTSFGAVTENTLLKTTDLSPSSPAFTAIDPYANPASVIALKPDRPFYYVVDKTGLTVMGLRDETTPPLMVTGQPVVVHKDEVVSRVPWPDAISVTQPNGEVPTDPTTEPDLFAHKAGLPGGTWEPVGITVSYPTEEALASNSETPPTYVYVVMKHSGFEWQSTPTADLAKGQDPNLRDKIASQPDPTKDDSLLVQVDVSDPTYPVDLFPTGAPIGGGLLGHNAGQPAFDPASDSVYVGNMPSASLPTTPQVPNDLTSFVSVAMLAPAELPAPGEGNPAPVTVTVLCGPEHPDIPLLAGVPEAWACIAEGGEGPFTWSFTNLPSWLHEHTDPVTGVGDGILYGTPQVAGTYKFNAHVDDHATTPPGTGDAEVTMIVSSDPTTEYEYGELEWEVGVPAAVAIEGTPKPGHSAADACNLEPTSASGSMVPNWVDVAQVSGRKIDNTALGGPVENSIGCVVMGTPPISGEHYEFQLPNLQFTWPSQNLPITISGQVGGPYTFDPLPTGVGLSGLAWHQIDKIHDPSTEADLLNREFLGVEPNTGQMYRILPAYAGLEAEGTIVPPPALQGELDEVSAYQDVLTPLKEARPDIAMALAEHPNLKVEFGNIASEAAYNPNVSTTVNQSNVFVTAPQIADPTGQDPTVIPIGGPAGSEITAGAIVNVRGARSADTPEELSVSAVKTIDVAGVQATYPALDSDLAPAIQGTEKGQVDHGALWVTGRASGNVAVVDTTAGKLHQVLSVAGADALGNVAVHPDTRVAYVSDLALHTLSQFGAGTAPQSAPSIISAQTASFNAGSPSGFAVTATGWPLPGLTVQGTLPSGVSVIDNGDGTAMLAGTPDVGTQGTYPLTITAANGVTPDATQSFVLTVHPATDVQGSWVGSYGADGYAIGAWTPTGDLNGLRNASLEVTQGQRFTWANPTADIRALQSPDGTTRAATTWFDSNQIILSLKFTAGYSGNVHLYAVDWDSTTRRQDVTVADTLGSQTQVLDTSFEHGAWLTFPIEAKAGDSVSITVARTAGANAVLSGIFLGEAPVQGNWVGNYGADGYVLGAWGGAADLAALKDAASLNLTQGQPFVWAGSTDDVRALQSPDMSTRKAATWFDGNQIIGSLSFPSGYSGNLHLYAVDWDSTLRQQTVAVVDDSGTQTQVLGGSFQQGAWLTFPINVAAGNSVTITVTKTAGANAVLSGIFLGDAGTTPIPPSAPTITSDSSANFVVGTAGSFTVTTKAAPTPTLTFVGNLPDGVTFTDNGDGTATLAGTPAAHTEGDYDLTIAAANRFAPDASQLFKLHVGIPPAIASAGETIFTAGSAGSFTVTATGTPVPKLTETGALPSGVTFADNGDGTAALAGTPAPGTGGEYSLTITASNGFGTDAKQAFKLRVDEAPAITSAASTTFTPGTIGTFTVKSSGYPTPKLTETGTLPGGVTFTDKGDGTATLTGNPAAGGTYVLTITAANGIGTNATQTFTLAVNYVVTISPAYLPGGTVRTAYSQQLTASGGVAPYKWATVAGTLPTGLRLDANTGRLFGTPTQARTYNFTVRATDSAGHFANRAYTVTIAAR